MKLTEFDIKYLKNELHENDASIKQIRRSKIRIEKYSGESKGKPERINVEEARKILGNTCFLSMLDRCVFHRTSIRQIDGNGGLLYFENRSF